MQRQRQSGLTTIELLVALAVLIVLVSVAVPLARWDEKRRREVELKVELRMMRDAIDAYRKAADEGRIQQKDVDQKHLPLDLDELVNGVDVINPATGLPQKICYLQRIPIDPFTVESEWGMRSYQDDWDATSWGGENLYDVYSLSDGKALDGTYYKDW